MNIVPIILVAQASAAATAPPPVVVAPPPPPPPIYVEQVAPAPPIRTVPVAPPPPQSSLLEMIFAGRTPPRPVGDPGSWISVDDYPPEALREEVQGTASFVLSVDKSGGVMDCYIGQSSGSSVLDAATCRLLRQRGRFLPAKDKYGQPVEGTYSSRVRWVVPEPDPLAVSFVDENGRFRDFALTYRFFIEADGTTSDCVVTVGDITETLDRPEGPCAPGKAYKPFLDASGKPVRKRVSVAVRSAIEERPGR